MFLKRFDLVNIALCHGKNEVKSFVCAAKLVFCAKTNMIERISCLMHFQCAKLLLTVCPATMFTEVKRRLRRRYPCGLAEWTVVQEGERLQPLVAAARSVRAVASSLTLPYNFNIRIN
jgi:hypothetical protein